jgi:small subunit ribosomal protein S19e
VECHCKCVSWKLCLAVFRGFPRCENECLLLRSSARQCVSVSVHFSCSEHYLRWHGGHLIRLFGICLAVVQIEVPAWSDLVKTATFKELAPYDGDWYYIRAASMARKIYLRQGIGVGAFRKIYGGRKSNGVRPSHFAKSSGSIARDCLKQLERLDIVEKDPKGGRRITSNGQRDLDQVAGRITVAAA